MWNLKYDTNELVYKTKTDSDIENRLVVAKGEGDGGGLDWEFGISRCFAFYTSVMYRMGKQQGPTV